MADQQHSHKEHPLQLFRTDNTEDMKNYKSLGLMTKMPFLFNCAATDRNFLRRSIESFSPMISDATHPELDVDKKGIFRNLSLTSICTLAREERGVKKKGLSEKDDIIDWLSFQVTQQDATIKQLENLVSMQQQLLEETRVSLEERPEHEEDRNKIIEGRGTKEIVNYFQQRIAERKKKREYFMKRKMKITVDELRGIM